MVVGDVVGDRARRENRDYRALRSAAVARPVCYDCARFVHSPRIRLGEKETAEGTEENDRGRNKERKKERANRRRKERHREQRRIEGEWF